MDGTNEADFRAFVDAQGHRLRGLAQVLTGNEHDAADLYQETLIKLFGSWSEIRASGAALRYARTTMTRQFISDRRRPWARRTMLQEPPERALAADALDRVDDSAAMRAALDGLSRQQRAVIVLRFYCDLSEAEIADHLKCSRGTVKTHMARALARLRVDASVSAFGAQQ